MSLGDHSRDWGEDARKSHRCSWCNRALTMAASDDCPNSEHRRTDATLGLREAGCGCCVIVDREALRLALGDGR